MKGGGYGVIADIVLGIIGGIVGGWIVGLLGLGGGGMILDHPRSNSRSGDPNLDNKAHQERSLGYRDRASCNAALNRGRLFRIWS